jgi:superfamily I DNA/RNA helicase
VHKSKGLEFDRVFELTPSLYPHPKSTKSADLDQEENALYVSSTREKEELHYVNDEEEK